MKSHLTDARSARPRMAFALLATITAMVFAFLPHVLASAAPKAITAAPAPSYGIWLDSTVPAVPSSEDAQSVTLGLVFSSATSGRLRGVQYYAAGVNRLATTGGVWNAAGRRIASVTFPTTSTDGWKTAWLNSPAKIRAGEKYTVSYRAANGHYAKQTDVFVNGRTLSADGLTAHRGTFTYGTGRPTEASQGSHYFVDVLFAPSSTTSSPTPEPTPTPTPTPEPTPTPTPAPEPTPTAGTCVKPDGSNTGATGTLTSYTGSTYVTTPGTVIENKQVNGDLTIAADNVTVRNVKVTGSLGVTDNTGARLHRITMREFFISSAKDVVLDQSDISGSITDGMHVTSDGSMKITDVKITNNYIHDPRPGAGSHYDGLQVRGADRIEVYCNNFDLGPAQFEYNAAVYLEPANGGHSGVVIDNNWLLGGGHIFHYGADNDGQTRLTNNHFGGEPYWGPNAVCHTSGARPAVQSGNDLRGAQFTPCP